MIYRSSGLDCCVKLNPYDNSSVVQFGPFIFNSLASGNVYKRRNLCTISSLSLSDLFYLPTSAFCISQFDLISFLYVNEYLDLVIIIPLIKVVIIVSISKSFKLARCNQMLVLLLVDLC